MKKVGFQMAVFGMNEIQILYCIHSWVGKIAYLRCFREKTGDSGPRESRGERERVEEEKMSVNKNLSLLLLLLCDYTGIQ